ncbi:MAG: non-heme iron oxygenase ferredoxin subunit [Microthrixaceae bacterium]
MTEPGDPPCWREEFDESPRGVADGLPDGLVDLGALADLVDGAATRVVLGDRELAVVRLGTDVYVIADRCSHADVLLSEGEVDDDEDPPVIECPKHGSAFDLRTGRPLALPATRPVPVYDARVVEGRVLVSSEPVREADR